MQVLTVTLNKEHNRKHFSCGEASLDNYLRNHAGQDRKRDISACYVWADADSGTVIGYYTLSCNSIASEIFPAELSAKLPGYAEYPTILIGRLAVDAQYHNKGCGELLLMDALQRITGVADQIGAVAVVVDALNDGAMRFYAKYGFRHIPSGRRMMIAMQTIRKEFC